MSADPLSAYGAPPPERERGRGAFVPGRTKNFRPPRQLVNGNWNSPGGRLLEAPALLARLDSADAFRLWQPDSRCRRCETVPARATLASAGEPDGVVLDATRSGGCPVALPWPADRRSTRLDAAAANAFGQRCVTSLLLICRAREAASGYGARCARRSEIIPASFDHRHLFHQSARVVAIVGVRRRQRAAARSRSLRSDWGRLPQPSR
jgi:hypothetical protein